MKLGVIGGSGLDRIAELEDARWIAADTPWGRPSDELLHGRIGKTEIVFLPRHGRGHRITPTELNARANIAALKMAGCTDVLSLSACGSFREELPPGAFVIVDQYVDRTRGRKNSYFGDGIVGHVSLADPACSRLAAAASASLAELDYLHQRGGSYLVMEGPQFSTKAESRLYRAAGLDVIGMTAMPEAALAREAELCYLTIAMVTDFDAWHESHDAVDVAQVVKVLHDNAERARQLVAAIALDMSGGREACPHGCDSALQYAIITAREAWPPATIDKLRPVMGRVLG